MTIPDGNRAKVDLGNYLAPLANWYIVGAYFPLWRFGDFSRASSREVVELAPSSRKGGLNGDFSMFMPWVVGG